MGSKILLIGNTRQQLSAYSQHNPGYPGGNRQYTNCNLMLVRIPFHMTIGEVIRRLILHTITTSQMIVGQIITMTINIVMREHSLSNSSASYGSHRDHRQIIGHTTHQFKAIATEWPWHEISLKCSHASTASGTLLSYSNCLESIKLQSNSTKKFAAKLNCEVFSREEMIKSNVAGTCGKEKLDMNKIIAIKRQHFQSTQLM